MHPIRRPNLQRLILPMLLLLLAALVGCADKGGAGDRDTADGSADMGEPDITVDLVDLVDAVDVTDTTPDTVVLRTGPAGHGIVAGGGTIQSSRFSMQVTVGGPSPATTVQSPGFQGAVGVGIPQLTP